MKMVLGMTFLFHYNINVQFGTEKLTWTFYTTAKALSITSWIELIDKRKFIKVVLNRNSQTLFVQVSALEATKRVYSS